MPEQIPYLRIDPGQTLNIRLLFDHAAGYEASDLLITAGAPPTIRVDGELFHALNEPLTPPETKRLLMSLLNETQREMLERKRELDFSLAVTGKYRFRTNLYYQKGALAGAFRIIPHEVATLEELGLPQVISELTLRSHGLILVTGPTGSGKSTTMASMIDLINRTRRCHVVTVEDPIEFVHSNKKSIIDQREVFADTLSYSNALKYVLRQDPDVILIGEMRDSETISAALTAAETGHLVIATLHTNDAIQTIDRIIDVFAPQHHAQIRVQLAFTLLAIIAQQLLPHSSGRGRVLCTELLIRNQAVAAHIREGKTHQTRSIIQGSRQEGMYTMDQSLKELYLGGRITWEELCRRISTIGELRNIPKKQVRSSPSTLKVPPQHSPRPPGGESE